MDDDRYTKRRLEILSYLKSKSGIESIPDILYKADLLSCIKYGYPIYGDRQVMIEDIPDNIEPFYLSDANIDMMDLAIEAHRTGKDIMTALEEYEERTL